MRRSRIFSARGCWRRRRVRWMSLVGRNTTVADVVARSRVSRRTFYELFSPTARKCLSAVIEDILATVAGEPRGGGRGGC